MEKEKRINWETVMNFSKKGKLVELLKSSDYPPSVWERQDHDGWSFIHYAAGFSGNHDALVMLIKAGCDLEKRTNQGNPPIYFAVHQIRPFLYKFKAAKVLIANGMRLNYLIERGHIPQSLIYFEDGVLRCISVIVTLLGLKKRKHHFLVKLDRFLIKHELAVAIWATRADEGIWQSKN